MEKANSIDQILREDYCEKFDELRKNRIAMSHYKYGDVKTNYKNNLIHALPSMQKCINKYLDTKNTEYLVDAANYLMFEFMYPQLKDAFFKETDSSGSAGISGMSIQEIKNIKTED